MFGSEFCKAVSRIEEAVTELKADLERRDTEFSKLVERMVTLERKSFALMMVWSVGAAVLTFVVPTGISVLTWQLSGRLTKTEVQTFRESKDDLARLNEELRELRALERRLGRSQHFISPERFYEDRLPAYPDEIGVPVQPPRSQQDDQNNMGRDEDLRKDPTFAPSPQDNP